MSSLALPALAARTDAYYPPSDAAGGWRVRNPSQLERMKLDAALERAEESTKNGGLLVAHRGWLVYERYFGLAGREATPNLASCGKSFTSIAMGILLGRRPDAFPDGLDQKVFTRRYLPADAFPLYDPTKMEIKLGQLLTMAAGLAGNNPAYVYGKEVTLKHPGPDGWRACSDLVAATTPLWTKPGGGYSYATVSPQLVSMILRHLTGMELQTFLEENIAWPLDWGRWGYGYKHPQLIHTPGGGGIALRSTDMLRFAYLLLREGSWASRQIVPARYVQLCGQRSPYNPHYPFSLQFKVNAGGELAPGAPHDAFWKLGSGGHAFYIVPSLDLVIYKIGGRDSQYNLVYTNVPPPPAGVLPRHNGSRKSWKRPSEPDSVFAVDVLKLVTSAFR